MVCPILRIQKGGKRTLITTSRIEYQKRDLITTLVPAVSVLDALKIEVTILMSNYVYMYE